MCVSNPNLSCQFPSQSPFLWAFADTVHQNEKLIISFSFLNILPEIQFFKNPFFFDWRIIALQYYVGFCHTATWISHKYTYVPSLLNPFSSPSPFTLCVVSERWVEPPVSHSKFPLGIYFTYGNVCFHAILSIHPTFSFSHCVHKSVPYDCISIAALKIYLCRRV